MQSVSKSLLIGKSLLWLILTISVGLVQIWMVLLLKLFDKSIVFSEDKLILDGTLMFFSSALIASITIDFKMEHKEKVSKTANELLNIFPFLVLGFTAMIYPLLLATDQQHISVINLKRGEIVILLASIFYAFGIKCIQFSSKGKK